MVLLGFTFGLLEITFFSVFILMMLVGISFDRRGHRITLTKSGTVIVYNDTNAMAVDIAGWVRDGIAFSYEFV